jgi:starch-binding outer membrane protein, SusD/RagB family
MKKILLSIIAIIILVLPTACNEDTIEIDPIGYTEAGFFSSALEFDWAARGIYQRVGIYFAFLGDPNRVIAAIWQLPDDDMTTGSTVFTEENFAGLNGTHDRLLRFYQASYQMIQRTNTLMEKQIERGPEIYGVNAQLRDWHRGEALFFRAYAHFMLWNIFGTAPVVTKRFSSIEEATQLTNSQGTQLLDQAISDLAEASNLLPTSWPTNLLNQPTLGRVTRNSALGLRAKALVFKASITASISDYNAAISDINAISGRSLVANYGNNFDANFENNSESLFEFQANRSIGAANPFVQNPDNFAAIGEIAHYVGYFNQIPTWGGNRFYTATPAILEAFHTDDPRKTHIFPSNPTMNGSVPNVIKYISRGSWLPGNTPPAGAGLNSNNPRILRLADVLLLKAEAIVMSGGNLSEAIDLINQIRTRARNSVPSGSTSLEPANRPTSTSRSEVINWIFEERRLELAFEHGARWFDLRRRHLATNPDLKIDLNSIDFQSVQQGVRFQNHNVYFPLPDSEVQQIPGLVQNPGY